MKQTEKIAGELATRLIESLNITFPLGGGKPFRDALIDALTQARNGALEEAARTPVLATNKLRNSNKDYSEGWFDGVEACLDAIRVLKAGE